MGAASLLAEIIAQRGRVLAASYALEPQFNALIERGFLEDAGIAQSVFCDDCDMPHDAEVVVSEGGQYGIHCPELGFIPKDRPEVAAVQPNLELLVKNLADVLGCRRTKSTPVHGETWRIGEVLGSTGNVFVYLHPVLRDDGDLQALKDALGRERTGARYGVVLTARGTLSAPPFRTALLKECIAFDVTKGRFVVDADLPAIAGVPAKPTGGRPSEYGHLLKPLIEERMRSGEAHKAIKAEIREVRAAFKAAHPGSPPSDSTIKRHIEEARGGS